ncbi:hypothetical protein P5X00_14575 [Paraburkholderia sp. A2RO-4L]|uniref:hypothetical protein n=1 Tax=Paraburkholderia sp. A2RO-4L TaxID=3028374 RepID=UPI003DA7CA45
MQDKISESPVPAGTVFLLDRNVVSLIKSAVDGRVPTDAKKRAFLDGLRALDLPENSFSPLLSLMEGEKGREDSAEEKAECLEKETEAIGRFFTRASTDTCYLRGLKDVVSELFAGMAESRWDDRGEFLMQAAPRVIQKVAGRERRDVEDELIRLAIASGLAPDDAIVMLLLACLYGSDAARRVIKPARPNAWNVLSDLHVISRVGMVKAVAGQSPIPIRVRFLTRDEGLHGVLTHVRIVHSQITASGGLQMGIRYTPGLFPDLAETDVIALLQRLEGAASRAGSESSMAAGAIGRCNS